MDKSMLIRTFKMSLLNVSLIETFHFDLYIYDILVSVKNDLIRFWQNMLKAQTF